jgi:hypothetical protein
MRKKGEKKTMIKIFFLEHAGEPRIIILRRKTDHDKDDLDS